MRWPELLLAAEERRIKLAHQSLELVVVPVPAGDLRRGQADEADLLARFYFAAAVVSADQRLVPL